MNELTTYQKEVIRYAFASFNHLINRGETISCKALAERIKTAYNICHPNIKDVCRCLNLTPETVYTKPKY